MNSWYNKGWVDKRFAERSADVFYRIDEASFRQGKVGFWMGTASTLGARLYSEENQFTHGIVSYGASQPINDIYGTEETKLKIPRTMYGAKDLFGGGIAITDKANGKDVTALLRFIDYLYSDEGAVLATFGLNKEQAASSELYKKYGLSEGAYATVEEDGKTLYVFADILQVNDGEIRNAMTLTRMATLKVPGLQKLMMTPTFLNSRQQWVKYPADGFLGGLNINQMTDDKAKEIIKLQTRIEQEYMHINVPQFITGKKTLEKDWDTFLKDLKKRNYEKVTEIYQAHFDSYK
jgi:putative aldouronate transport system substrate-binding protein